MQIPHLITIYFEYKNYENDLIVSLISSFVTTWPQKTDLYAIKSKYFAFFNCSEASNCQGICESKLRQKIPLKGKKGFYNCYQGMQTLAALSKRVKSNDCGLFKRENVGLTKGVVEKVKYRYSSLKKYHIAQPYTKDSGLEEEAYYIVFSCEDSTIAKGRKNESKTSAKITHFRLNLIIKLPASTSNEFVELINSSTDDVKMHPTAFKDGEIERRFVAVCTNLAVKAKKGQKMDTSYPSSILITYFSFCLLELF
ncbi:hypothetical protein EGR_02014 [Echinococcus granulosus]|uniref:Uncharacterized protein n=1 Tax=Echinococcus granulosus TaxID=6210 RepID=W6UNJ6_ECHGR|nr:hypothetical protein EGR_02014 [Echinococcus granulosus]EUB63210.1 hypothetical protein EGR_02014 [Echinococcus granulosus]